MFVKDTRLYLILTMALTDCVPTFPLLEVKFAEHNSVRGEFIINFLARCHYKDKTLLN